MGGRLEDKTAIVVGAGSIGPGWGNGKATAVTFARAGARVLCVDIDAAAARETVGLIEGEGGTALAERADVTDKAQVDAMVARALGLWGKIDILHNNVGIVEAGGPVETDEASWDRVIAVNLKSMYLTCKAVLPVMEAAGRGAIVNIGGLSAHRPARDRAPVIAAKAGIVGLTKALAAEGLGQIRANCVVPGQIETERKPGQPQAHFTNDETEARGSCEDVARVVLAFSNPKDGYVTGQTVHVSGGRYMA